MLNNANTPLLTQLKQGVSELNLTLTEPQYAQLIHYLNALGLWYKKFNEHW